MLEFLGFCPVTAVLAIICESDEIIKLGVDKKLTEYLLRNLGWKSLVV